VSATEAKIFRGNAAFSLAAFACADDLHPGTNSISIAPLVVALTGPGATPWSAITLAATKVICCPVRITRREQSLIGRDHDRLWPRSSDTLWRGRRQWRLRWHAEPHSSFSTTHALIFHGHQFALDAT
jgi:hypothetical protein